MLSENETDPELNRASSRQRRDLSLVQVFLNSYTQFSI